MVSATPNVQSKLAWRDWDGGLAWMEGWLGGTEVEGWLGGLAWMEGWLGGTEVEGWVTGDCDNFSIMIAWLF